MLTYPAAPPRRPEAPLPDGLDLPVERKAELSAFWHAVLSGATKPEPLPIQPDARERVAREFPDFKGEVLREACEELTLQRLYGGRPIVHLDTPNGKAILAVGRAEQLHFVLTIPLERWRDIHQDEIPFCEEIVEE